MNAVEIEAAISDLAQKPFDTAAFPLLFLEAFGNKDTTLKRLERGNRNGGNNAFLLARESHFPATIADLYDPETMPENLRHAHERNDEVLEQVYIGRRFKNDTERLEKLFELYTQMTAKLTAANKSTKTSKPKKVASQTITLEDL